ncbi:dipeptidase [Novosphingobium sp. TH158]|uniref:dipeptidase n=1 Tax=Novosphingobium sp. TH158 TaxID=2067455 RepID=UPI000C7B2C3A|nr:dipeptidase [Novosphingobium sp. TH158]PLK27438.1 membrane dipeptidase [Novosphingobium sp. TH158]
MRVHSITFAALAALISGPSAAGTPEQVADAALKAQPVWDGHNDVPEQLRDRRKNVLAGFDFQDTTGTADPAKGVIAMQTDLNRSRKGRLGAQFWSVYVSANLPEPQAVQATLEQIDTVKRLVALYPKYLQFCVDSACVAAAQKAGRIASLIGMEGGHSIGGSLAVLRQMHALGARYMTLTHFKTTAWADAATDEPRHDGLTPFGEDVVREMQRLGMLVDLSHVSEAAMLDAMRVARAPVFFSHSNAQALNSHPRNVSDTALKALKANGGIVMINFYPAYVVGDTRAWSIRRSAEKARIDAVNLGNPAAAKAEMAAWEKANPAPSGTLADVANQIDYVAKLIGPDHVGLGGDLDGIDTTVKGMEDVSTYPALFVELARRGWSQTDLEKLAGRNMMRVLRAAEAYAASRRGDPPIENPTAF